MAELNIQNLGSGKISKADLEKYFANDSRLDKILSIFDKINSLDGENTEFLSDIDLTEMSSLRYAKDSNGLKTFASLDNRNDKNITDYELETYFNKAKEFYGEDILLDDYKKFLEFAISKGNEEYISEIEEVSRATGMSKELIENLGGPSLAQEYQVIVKDGVKYYQRTVDGFTQLCDENGKLVELREQESTHLGYEDYEQITTFNEDGSSTESYLNHETDEQIKFHYAQNPEEKSYKMHYKDGVAVKQTVGDGDKPWKDMQLEDIVFGVGTPDTTKVSFKYDENNQLTGIDIKDENLEEDAPRGYISDGTIYLTHIPKKTNLEKQVFESIKQMVDGGARYGEDFDLKIVDGQLKIVPKIKNETGEETPELKGDAFKKYKELISKGIHAGEDFDVEYDENGNFRYSYKNNQAKEFDAEYKTEVYDKAGNLISSLTVKDGQIIQEKNINGKVETLKMSFDDAFIQFLIEGNFAMAGEILGKDDILSGGYNIYPMAEKYKQITGKELIGDVYDELKSHKDNGTANLMAKLQPHIAYNINHHSKEEFIKNYQEGYEQFKDIMQFNPYDSQIADLLPKIQRVQHSGNSYTEQINNNKFDINFTNGEIIVTKNGEKVGNLNVSKFPQNYVKNVLLKTPANVLSDMIECGIELILDDSLGDSLSTKGTNGFYKPTGKGQITLDPNALIGNRAIKTIVHEAGHMCDHIDSKENAIKAIKEMMKDPWTDFGRDKAVTINELLENWGTLQPVSIHDEKLKECFEKEYAKFRKNPPNINENAQYALTSMVEFFAESYALLESGTCKSEYVLANYFPESLARVKEIIEENRAYRNSI